MTSDKASGIKASARAYVENATYKIEDVTPTMAVEWLNANAGMKLNVKETPLKFIFDNLCVKASVLKIHKLFKIAI